MDTDEPFVYNEVDYKTPKQSPQTWPMDKIRQSRFQHKMSSLLSPVTPKRSCNISNARSLLLQCLRDAKSDPIPSRRFPVSCSDEGILMDGVLVTSAAKKKVSDSPSSYPGRSARSSIFQSQHKDTEFSSPRSESGRNQETTQSHQQSSSAGKGKMLANSPCTPKAANPSKLQASAEPFILTPRQASPFPPQQLPYDPYNPQFPCAKRSTQTPITLQDPLHLRPNPYLHRPRPLIYVYQRPSLLPLLPHGPDPYYQLNCQKNFPPILPGNQTPISYLPIHTPISTTPTANLSTSTTTTTTTHGSSPSVDGHDKVTQILDLSPSPSGGLDTMTQIDLSSTPSDGLKTVTQKPDLSSPSVGLETVTQKPDLPSLSAGLQTMTQRPDLTSPSVGLKTVTQKPDLRSPSAGLQTMTQNPDLTSPSAGLQTMTTNRDWSPSDDGLPTFTQAQLDFMKSHNRLFPDYVFGHYKYKKRMSAFRHQEEDQ